MQCNAMQSFGATVKRGSASISHGSKTLEVRVKLEAKIFLEMIFVKNQTFITSYVSWMAKISTLKYGLSILNKKNQQR